ncbi:MAG: SUMF1/EgtB/PvdO family nonheme iron enzyme, partial [Phycisphaerales bacterium]
MRISANNPAVVAVSLACLVACFQEQAPAEVPDIESAFVSGDDAQPDGPVHDYRISAFEITNAQFITFLNDALANLGNERGAYMYFDTDSGDVYINGAATGTIGTAGSGTLMFDASVNGWIVYDPEADPTPGYVPADAAFVDHPVTGVTWYGAVKFSNWLTIAAGLPAEERCYFEAPNTNLNGWRPVTSIDDATWASRDLNAAEREALLDQLGYRLPMDEGAGTASPYNEWYKAAAWDGTGHTVYGFGRDTIAEADANYNNSGDPFESGATPVGFYDGTLYNPGGGGPVGNGSEFATNADENAYGLFDMSGNVWEWMQDQGSDVGNRRNRSGSWRSSATSLAAAIGAVRNADSASDSTGIRIVQSVPEALVITPTEDYINSGPWGGPYDDPEASTVYQVSNVTDSPVDFLVDADVDWVEIFDPSGGVIAGGETIDITVALAPICVSPGGMTVGENVATIAFENLTDQATIERLIRLTVLEPLSLTPSTAASWTIRFGEAAPPAAIYTLDSASDSSVDWSAVWIDTSTEPESNPAGWLLIDGSDEAFGSVSPQGTTDVEIGVDAMPGGTPLSLGTYEAEVGFIDECTGTEFFRNVTLNVDPWFSVEPIGDAMFVGAYGGPFEPSSHVFTLSNLTASDLDCSVAIEPPDQTWLAVDNGQPTVPASGNVAVTASLTEYADQLGVGEYTVTVFFTYDLAGFTITRDVMLTVTDLQVAPTDAAAFSGPLGGPFSPAEYLYTIQNGGIPDMEWSASFTPGDGAGDWLELEPSFGFILDPGGTAEVSVRLTSLADALDTGTYIGTITFENLSSGASTTRGAELIIGSEAFRVETVSVPAEDAQPGGPQHLFRIGKFEVTNTEYTRFLNNAKSNPDNARGSYLYFDTSSGSVYINDQEQGSEGVSPPTDTLLYDASVGSIQLQNDVYVIGEAEESFPVVGVSWYGAVKFCNWLTVVQGMDAGERAYLEGPSAAAWLPADTNENLATDYAGFRLPMDDGQGAASLYNEWYKAAAWIDMMSDNSLYGFGRDSLANVDANYLASDDPYEIGATPVGFYDGMNELDGGAGTTVDTDNGYGLYDLCGNVSEWVHDQGTMEDERAVRGGHFQNSGDSDLLRADVRGSLPAAGVYAFVGFRVAQSYAPVDLTVSQSEDNIRADGFVGGAYCVAGRVDCEQTFTLAIENPSEHTIDDVSFGIEFPAGTATWLEVEGLPPSQIPPTSPDSPLEVAFRLTDAALTLPVSPAPPGSRQLVLGGTDQTDPLPPAHDFYQPDGPTHDFWVGTTEVTNAEFQSFLTDTYALALNGVGDERCDYMYFDGNTGSVYVHDQEPGEVGAGEPAQDVILMYDTSVGRILFDGEAYVIEQGYDNHPAVGVTWYGAVKYCNWLTIVTENPEEMRAYLEGPSSNPADWRPITAVNWENGVFSAAEREGWVRRSIGYRLPMDDFASQALSYNEWYKAASWDFMNLVNRDFGFGRDLPLQNADGNYDYGGDADFDDTTPIAFFNGVNLLPDGETVTQATDNAYGLFDLCGNVSEWTNDFFEETLPSERAVRGGNWRDRDPEELSALLNTGREPWPADSANDETGFRVVLGAGHVATVTITDNVSNKTYKAFFILNLREPVDVQPRTDVEGVATYGMPEPGDYEGFADCLSGPNQELPVGCTTEQLARADRDRDGDVDLSDFGSLQIGGLELIGFYTITNQSDSDMDWHVTVDQSWIDLIDWDVGYPGTSDVSGTLDGYDTASGYDSVLIEARTNDGINQLGAGEHEGVLTFLNETTGQSQTRSFLFVVGQPIEVATQDLSDPEYSGFFGGPFAPDGGDPSFILTSNVSFDLTYNVDLTGSWLTIDGQTSAPLNGNLQPSDQLLFHLLINEEAEALPVGAHEATVTFTWTDPGNGDVSGEVIETVKLWVIDPVVVCMEPDPPPDCPQTMWSIDPEDPMSQVFTLTNYYAESDITVLIAADVEWILFDDQAPVVLPGVDHTVSVTGFIDEQQTQAFPPASYPATITFTDTLTGQELDWEVELTVGTPGALYVLPSSGLAARGREGGPYIPASIDYEVINVPGGSTLTFDISFDPAPGPAWLTIGAYDPVLDPGESTIVTVSINTAEADLLLPGIYPAATTDLVFQPDVGEAVRRSVQLEIVDPILGMQEESTAGLVDQPGGPAYDF